MSLFRAEQRQITVPWAEWLQGNEGGSNSESGELVTSETVLGVAAAWSCAVLLADVVSSLPVDQYTKSAGIRTPVAESEIIASPSNIFTRREWIFQAVLTMAIDGNAVGQIISRDDDGTAAKAEWVNPRDVQVKQSSQLVRPDYTIFHRPVPYESVIHLRRFPRTGSAVGLSPLDKHRELFGLAQASRKYAAQWFGDGGHPAGLLTNDNAITEDIAKEAKRRWRLGGRGREVRTLGAGWKYQTVQASPGDSELVETWNRVGLEVAQAFRVPPEMIGVASSGSSVTYVNREQRAVDFLTFTIEPWLTIFEDWWRSELANARPAGQFAKFNTGNLLRSDITTRYRSHDIAIRMGLASVNERRALEDLPPIADGDEYLWPPYRAFPVATDE